MSTSGRGTMMKHRGTDQGGIVRRDFLKSGLLAASGALLMACTATPAAPTAATGAPTAAPASPPTPVPPARPTAAPQAPTAAPAAAPTTAPAGGVAAVQTPTDPGKPVTLEFWGGGPEHLANYQRLMA